MKAMLTGATGFLGSHTAEALLAAGHDVRALVRSPERVACNYLIREMLKEPLDTGSLNILRSSRNSIFYFEYRESDSKFGQYTLAV